MQASGLQRYSMLIVGEVRRGKTRLTAAIARALAPLLPPGSVFVADFAPGVGGVGEPMEPPPGSVYRRPRGLRAPRLESRGDCGLAWRLARENAERTSRVLEEYLSSPTPVLVVNDATIHLHAGDPSLLLEALEAARVFVGNAYSGRALRDECGISEREERLLGQLAERVDFVFRL